MKSMKVMENGAGTRKRIMETAEQLFALHGFEGTSLRQITQEAGVNLAAVNYHFGSKEGLLRELVKGRIALMNEKRLRLLERHRRERGGEPLRLEMIYDAFIRPFFQTSAPGGGLDPVFLHLLGRAFSELPGFMREMYEDYFKKVHSTFVEAIAEAEPDLPREEIHWRYQFSLSLMLASMSQRKRMRHSFYKFRDPDALEEMLRRLIDFICAGFRGPHGGEREKEKGGEKR